MAAGGLLLGLTFLLGLGTGLGRGAGASGALAWLVLLGAPAGVVLLGGVETKALRSVTAGILAAGWLLANLPRLLGLAVTAGAYRTLALVAGALLLGAFGVMLWTRKARGAFVVLVFKLTLLVVQRRIY